MTATEQAGAADLAPREVPAVDPAPRRARRRQRMLLHALCLLVSLFMALPIYLSALAALATRQSLNEFPLDFLPVNFSTETMGFFLSTTGVIPGFVNSLIVGLMTLVLSLLIGTPAGYAVARYAFRGRDTYQLFLLFTRALPIVVLSVPLAQLYLSVQLYDSNIAVALLHAALALPTTILITASVFVSVPRDVEEAGKIFGCTPLQAFLRIVMPLALPGVAAASIFTFVLSWNEVLGATILTLNRRTLPAQVLTTLSDSPLAYRFAGGFALVVPALLFIAVMRKYLLNMWGTTLR